MARAMFLLLLFAGIFHTATAHADHVRGLRSADLAEVSHKVRVTMHPGYAELIVERTVFNPGPRHDQATFDIDMPPGAVAVGLRTLGLKNGAPHWYDGELLEAEEAARRYKELTGIGGYYPKDPALLSWRSMYHLKLQVFPCPPREKKSIEYTLLVPTEYREGAHYLSLSGLGTSERVPHVTLGKSPRGSSVFAHDVRVSSGQSIRPSPQGDVVLKLVQPIGDIRLELARADTGEGRAVQRATAHIGRLSEVPKAVDVVLLLDRSHSMIEKSIAGARLAADAYLSHAPHARVQIITFGRTPQAEFNGFVPASIAAQQLLVSKWKRENGSNIEAALLLAAQAFKKTPAGHKKRLVVLTDALTSSRVTPARISGLAKTTGALVHFGVVNGVGMPDISRMDMDGWSRAAERTGGLVWTTTVPHADADVEDSRAVFEEWMRPLRIFDVKMGINMQDPLVTRSDLAEGEGITDLSLADDSREALYLRGKLWARPITRGATADPQASARWAGLIFGNSLHSQLSEDEMFFLAKRANAVSPVTSLLAIEPGVRPSTEGIEWGTGTGMGFGRGLGRLGRAVRIRGIEFDHRGYLEKVLKKHWAACGGHGTAVADLETTRDEIVEVLGVSAEKFKDAAAETCLLEALWDERLPKDFRADFQSFQVRVN